MQSTWSTSVDIWTIYKHMERWMDGWMDDWLDIKKDRCMIVYNVTRAQAINMLT